MSDVVRVVELARANNIPEIALSSCADRSMNGFGKLMEGPLPGETDLSLDATLVAEAQDVIREFEGASDLIGLTQTALNEVRAFLEGRVERHPWQKWTKLSKLKPAVKDEPKFQGLKAAASAFARHPRLLAHAEAYVRAVFSAPPQPCWPTTTISGHGGSSTSSIRNGSPSNCSGSRNSKSNFANALQTVFVDEFQDTSPLQLAVFVAMSRLAGSSVWVGDPKQSIYRFRQTDPDLITYVAQDIRKATGGANLTLDRNWRSRPGLVAFFNDTFAPTFEKQGLPPEACRIAHVERTDIPGQGIPLNVWRVVKDASSSYAGSLSQVSSTRFRTAQIGRLQTARTRGFSPRATSPSYAVQTQTAYRPRRRLPDLASRSPSRATACSGHSNVAWPWPRSDGVSTAGMAWHSPRWRISSKTAKDSLLGSRPALGKTVAI